MFKRIYSMLPMRLMFFDGTGDAAAGGAGGAGGGAAPAEPVAEEREDRISRAEEMWKASETTDADAGKAAADKEAADKAAADAAAAAGGEKIADEKKAADDKAAADAAAAGDDSKLPYFNDARFQEIYKAHNDQKATLDAFTEIFTDKEGKLGYTIDSDETLKGVLTDAYTLYDIAGGKKGVAELLTTFEKNWKPEQFTAVLQDMANFAASKGIKIDDKAVADKPWEKEINALRNELGETKKAQTAREDREKAVKEETERMDTVVTPMITKVTELAKAIGLDPKVDQEEIDDFCNHVSAAIGADKNKAKIIEQVKKGQWGEIERLFTEHNNKLVARAKRLADTVLKAKIDKDKTIPKVPAGGAAAAETKKGTGAKRDLKTSEGRVAAAQEEWKKSASS